MFELHELTGVLPALISPLRKDSKVDEAAVGRLVEHVIDGGVHGLLALGSTGETASLDETARRTLLSNVVAAADGRVPVICGVAQSHLAAARIEVEAAARLGAAAALVAPPFYYLIDQATLLAFYRSLAKDSPLPILLYNIPQFTKVVAQPETVATLAREGTIVGIKDSSRDFEYFEGVCIATRDLPRFRIFTGSDTMLLPALAMGGAGTICGAANVAPGWIVRIYESSGGPVRALLSFAVPVSQAWLSNTLEDRVSPLAIRRLLRSAIRPRRRSGISCTPGGCLRRPSSDSSAPQIQHQDGA